MPNDIKNIAIVTTHPIQYQVPWFRELHNTGRYNLKVFFGMQPSEVQQGTGFVGAFTWDIPLLEGYAWEVLDNRAKNPGVDNFSGCDTPEIGQVLKTNKIDMLIVTGWNSKLLLQAATAARKLNIPVVVRGDSNSLKPRSLVKKLFHRHLLKKYDQFLSVGTCNTEFYLSNGVKTKYIINSPHFVENERFTEYKQERNLQRKEERSRLQIPEDVFCFVYSGKLTRKKHVLDLIMGFHKVFRDNTRSHFLIVGDGELRGDLEKYVNENQLPVTFVGFINQSEIPAMYFISDCILLGSDYDETWGLVINEAMVCGLPAIVSDRVGCGPDLIVPGETGYVYQFGDIEHLAGKMAQMVNHPEVSRKMGKKAQVRVLENYNVAKSVNAVHQAIASLS